MAPNIPSEFQFDDILSTHNAEEQANTKTPSFRFDLQTSVALKPTSFLVEESKVEVCDEKFNYWEWGHEKVEVGAVNSCEAIDKEELLRNILSDEERFLSFTGRSIAKRLQEEKHEEIKSTNLVHSQNPSDEKYWDWSNEESKDEAIHNCDEYWTWQNKEENVEDVNTSENTFSKEGELSKILAEEERFLSMAGSHIWKFEVEASRKREAKNIVYANNKKNTEGYWDWDDKTILYTSREMKLVDEDIIQRSSEESKDEVIQNSDEYWTWQSKEEIVEDLYVSEHTLSKEEEISKIFAEEERFLSTAGCHIWKLEVEASRKRKAKNNILNANTKGSTEGYWDWDDKTILHTSREIKPVEDMQNLNTSLAIAAIDVSTSHARPTIYSANRKSKDYYTNSYWDWEEKVDEKTFDVEHSIEISKEKLIEKILAEEDARMIFSSENIINNLLKKRISDGKVWNIKRNQPIIEKDSSYWDWQ